MKQAWPDLIALRPHFLFCFVRTTKYRMLCRFSFLPSSRLHCCDTEPMQHTHNANRIFVFCFRKKQATPQTPGIRYTPLCVCPSIVYLYFFVTSLCFLVVVFLLLSFCLLHFTTLLELLS